LVEFEKREEKSPDSLCVCLDYKYFCGLFRKGGTIELNQNNTNEEELKNTPEAETQDVEATSQKQEEASETSEESNNQTEQSEPVAKKGEDVKEEEPKMPSPESVTPGDFDWSMDKEGFSTYSDQERKQLENMYSGTVKSLDENSLVMGKVVSMTKKDVVLNVGHKSDGLVARTEFRDMPDLAVGDEVEVWVESTEDALGQLVLSRKKAIQESAWDKILDARENGNILKGYVKSRTKGGLVVDLLGMDAFLPGSQIDVKPIRDYDIYVGKTMEFKVVKVNEAFKNVVISHKALIEDDIEAQKGEILSKLEKGQVLEGTVKNMTSFGVFVDLGGVDGLLHITDISWGRINHPEEVLELDQKINVVVLDFDDEKKRISLGLKQLTPHPWEKLSDDIKEGSKVKGKVVTVADYGAFVEIEPGIEGLIHVTEMSWSQHLRNPQDFLNVGDEVEAKVLSLDKEENKMSLGLKQLTEDPWENIEQVYPVDSKHTGIVRNLTNYGLFVELSEGVDGLVHVSDLSWSKKIKHPAEFTKKGEELEVVVLEIDKDNRRLSLGHKQIDENPWDTFATIFAEGTEHEGTVIEVNDKGAVFLMPYGVEAFAPGKHTKKEDKTPIKVDDVLQLRVIEFNKDAKRILVSHTDIWKEVERSKRSADEAENTRKKTRASKNVQRVNQNVERATLGGELDVLSKLKKQMENQAEEETTEAKETKKEEAPAKAKKEEAKEEPKPKKAKAKKAEPKKEKSVEEPAEPKVDLKAMQDELIEALGKGDASSTDDLKRVNGIGPVYEKKLNELGIFSYDQLAKLDAASIEKLETLTKWSGRVERDNWVEQAKALASEK
jgi:small subunit ribosomal protein S1